MPIVTGLTFSRTGFVGCVWEKTTTISTLCVFVCLLLFVFVWILVRQQSPVFFFSMALVGLTNSQRLELIHGVLNLLGLLFRKLVDTGLSHQLNEAESVLKCFPLQFRGCDAFNEMCQDFPFNIFEMAKS